MNIRRFFAICALFVMAGPALLQAFEKGLPALENSQAYLMYSRQPQSELSKLLYLLNRLKESRMAVIYDGHEYSPLEASKFARRFLVRNYKKETAEYWIKKYCRKTDKGNLILVKDPSNQKKSASEVILEELESLQQIAKP